MEQDKQRKLLFIMEHVAENGIDTSKFNKFLADKYSKFTIFNARVDGGYKVENMTYEQVVSVVREYKQFKDGGLKIPQNTVSIQKKLQESQDSLKIQETAQEDLLELGEEALYSKLKKSELNQSSKPFFRKQQLTKSISGNNKSEINFKQVQMEVLKSEVVKSGIFSSDYVIFYVQTEIPHLSQRHIVQRKDSDFYALRKVLLQNFPYTIVPALPQKSTKNSEKELRNRVQLYNRFLTGVSRSEILKSCKFVLQFLTITDRNYWKIEKKGYEKLRFSRKIEDVISKDGQVSVEERQDSKKFCDDLKNFSAVFTQITKEAIQLSKEVNQMSDQLAFSVNKLALCLKDLGKLYKKIKVNSQSKLFSRLSDLFKDTSANLKNQGNLTKIYCGQAMKYYEQEHQPLEELFQFRESYKNVYEKFQKDLDERKNLLFKLDFSNWGYTQGSLEQLIGKSQDLLKDKTKAFRYMLTADSLKLQEMGEELNFYTNQCLDEVRRVGKDNGEALIDHFMDQGKIQCDYLQQQFDKWSQFVSYFGSLEWDKPVEQKKKKKKHNKLAADFEFIDDKDQSEKEDLISFLQENGIDDEDFELIGAAARASKTVQTKIDKNSQEQDRGNSGTVESNIGVALKRLLNESVLSQSGPGASNQNSTEQTSEKSLLFTPPTVITSRKKTKENAHKTAPIFDNSNKAPARGPPVAPSSSQNRMTTPINDSSISPTDQQQSHQSSIPMFAGSDPIVSSTTSKSNLNVTQNEQEALPDPTNLSSGSSSAPQTNNKSIQNFFSAEFQAALATDVILEESEQPSSEEPTLRNDTIVIDLLNQPDLMGDLMSETQKLIHKSRSNTTTNSKQKSPSRTQMPVDLPQKPPMREQTITNQFRHEIEQIPIEMPKQIDEPIKNEKQQNNLNNDSLDTNIQNQNTNVTQGEETKALSLQEQILMAQQKLRKVPQTENKQDKNQDSEPEKELVTVTLRQPELKPVTLPAHKEQQPIFPTLKPLTSLAFDRGQIALKDPNASPLSSNQSKPGNVQQILTSKRQSILTPNQVEKLSLQDVLQQQLSKLKPVVVDKNAPALQPKKSVAQGFSVTSSVAGEFKTETAVQKNIRKILMNEKDDSSSEEGNKSFAFDQI